MDTFLSESYGILNGLRCIFNVFEKSVAHIVAGTKSIGNKPVETISVNSISQINGRRAEELVEGDTTKAT
jgi:hypothetical protein